MRVVAVFLLVAAACDGGTGPEPMQCKEGLREVALGLTADVDLLVVVGNASSMAEEQAALAEQVSWLVDRLAGLSSGMPNLHIAVVSDDGGRLLLPPACPDLTDGRRFITDEAIDPETGTRQLNHVGELADQLACMVRVGTGGDEVARPLAAAARALESEASGFRRAAASLVLAFVTDRDDASRGTVDAYRDRIVLQAPGSATAFVSVVSGPAPRLVELARLFDTEGVATSLDAPEVEGGLWAGVASLLPRVPVGACIDERVSVPADCRVSDVRGLDQPDQAEYPLADCAEAGPPCFAIFEDQLACPAGSSHLRLVIERGDTTPREGTVAIASCLIEEPCR